MIVLGSGDSARPEAIIAEIYRQLQVFKERRKTARGVVMSRMMYENVQAYRNSLGELSNPNSDYLGRYQVFGLEFLVDENADAPLVIG